MGTVNEFCTSGTINSKHNSTFITLIPNKDHIETIKDCRPIFLLTSVYKIIAKVLDTRLKLFMVKLISPVQCAYIEGRKIIDGTLIANELVDSRIRSGNDGIVCKIDLEKAFDRINWRYLEFVLHQMGFSRKWCNWLRFCYSTSSFSVLINGSSFGYFTSTRGVRQGCPISPLLFNTSVEGFSRFMDRASNQSFFSGFSVSPISIIVNHLHYADDTIFFVDNKKEELHNLFSALHCFEFIAGLKEGAKNSHLVNWDLVRATKEKGGLGVCNLKIMNLALLAKWCWRFGVKKNKLSYKIGEYKYGTDFSKWPGNITQTYGVSCWRVIAGTASLISENSTLFVHSGSAIAFWNDIWCGEHPLATVSPNLYKLSRNRNVTIADMISMEGNWKFEFKRVLTNLEVEEYAALLTIIGDNPLVQDALPDTRRWKLQNSGIFTVKSLYAKMIAESGVDNFPYQFIWRPSIPPKINILMWCLLHGKLNTIDVLQHKGMDLYNSCVLCGIGVESQDHLFLHCKIAYKIWSGLLPNTGWVWVVPGAMNDLADMWHHNHFSSSGNYIWSLIPAAVVNTIWRRKGIAENLRLSTCIKQMAT
ncbi:uncharacterized protein LOC113316434 [Papaver somniferum]|uniref:uncharacterized protein LOC113316434 n=1 Tax=Papaver somniferum TaxID=3469 RepID=UPI000E6FD48C|nr:uncharacterized protein LOC113316434 [Papaver somniferum]